MSMYVENIKGLLGTDINTSIYNLSSKKVTRPEVVEDARKRVIDKLLKNNFVDYLDILNDYKIISITEEENLVNHYATQKLEKPNYAQINDLDADIFLYIATLEEVCEEYQLIELGKDNLMDYSKALSKDFANFKIPNYKEYESNYKLGIALSLLLSDIQNIDIVDKLTDFTKANTLFFSQFRNSLDEFCNIVKNYNLATCYERFRDFESLMVNEFHSNSYFKDFIRLYNFYDYGSWSEYVEDSIKEKPCCRFFTKVIEEVNIVDFIKDDKGVKDKTLYTVNRIVDRDCWQPEEYITLNLKEALDKDKFMYKTYDRYTKSLEGVCIEQTMPYINDDFDGR